MKRIIVILKDIEAVKDFVGKVSRFPFDVDLLSGRYIIDAKSIMGVLSLDLAQPLQMVIHTEQCDEILDAINAYIVEG